MPFARLTAAVSLLALTSAAMAQDIPLAPLSNYGKVAISGKQSAGGFVAFEQAFGGVFDAEPVVQYPEASELRRLGRAVGRLDVAYAKGVGYCTGFLISEQYLMTNAHCIDAGPVQSISFIAGYVESGVEEGTRIYNVGASPVEFSPRDELDFAILQVFGNPSKDWGTVKLAALEIDSTRDAGMPLMVLGHPVFQVAPVPVPQPLYVSRKECRATATRPRTGNKLRHTCDTLVGNSGSPVFSDDSREVIALHHAGDPREGINFAIPMSLIAAQSEIVASLVSVSAKPDDQLTALQAELERLRKERAAALAAAEAERKRLAEAAAQKAEAERKKLAEQLAALQAERDKLAAEKAEAEKKAAQAARGAGGKTDPDILAGTPLIEPLQSPVPRAASDTGLAVRPRTIPPAPDSTRFSASHWRRGPVSIETVYPDLDALAFSPDLRRLAIGSSELVTTIDVPGLDRDMTRVSVVIHDLQKKQAQIELKGLPHSIHTLAFSDNGDFLMTGISDGTTMVWDAATGEHLSTIPHGVSDARSISGQDPALIVTNSDYSEDNPPVIWDAVRGEALLRLEGHAKGVSVNEVVFSPDGTQVVTGAWDGTAKIWDIATGRPVMEIATLQSGEEGFLDEISFSRDGSRLFLISKLWAPEVKKDVRRVTVIDTVTKRRIARLEGAPYDFHWNAVSPDGTTVISRNGYDGHPTIWSVAEQRIIGELKLNAGEVGGMAFSPDGQRLLVPVRESGIAVILDTRDWSQIAEVRVSAENFFDEAFLPDGRRFMFATWGEGAVKIWGGE